MHYHLVNAGAVVLAPVVEAVVDVLLAPHPREARGTLAPLVGLSMFGHNSKDCNQRKHKGKWTFILCVSHRLDQVMIKGKNGVGCRLTG